MQILLPTSQLAISTQCQVILPLGREAGEYWRQTADIAAVNRFYSLQPFQTQAYPIE